jgi:hypothetical protein
MTIERLGTSRNLLMRAIGAVACIAAAQACAGDVTELDDPVVGEEVRSTELELTSVTRSDAVGATMAATGGIAIAGSGRRTEFCDGTRHALLTRIRLERPNEARESSLMGETCEGARVWTAAGSQVFFETTHRDFTGDLVMMPLLGGTPTVIEPRGRGVAEVFSNGVFAYYTRIDPQTRIPSVHRWPVQGGVIERLNTSQQTGAFRLLGTDTQHLYFVHTPYSLPGSQARILRASRDGNTVTEVGTLAAGFEFTGGAVGTSHVFIAESQSVVIDGVSRRVSNVWRMKKSDRSFGGLLRSREDRLITSLKYESSKDRLYWATTHSPRLGQARLQDDHIESVGRPNADFTSMRKDYDNNTFLHSSGIFPTDLSGVPRMTFQEAKDGILSLVVGAP